MVKNIAIALLVIACLAEGAYIVKAHFEKKSLAMQLMTMQTTKKAAPSGALKRPPFLAAGTKFQDNPLFSKAYKIAPGDLSDDAKKALVGWDLKQQTLADGSIQVNLIPHDADDVQQEFIVKSGYSLYFIETNIGDDKPDQDGNRGDDIGVLVDQNGIIQ